MHVGIGHLRTELKLAYERGLRDWGALTLREPNRVKATLEFGDIGELLCNGADLLVHVAELRYALEVRML